MNTAIIIQSIGLLIGLLHTPGIVQAVIQNHRYEWPGVLLWGLGWTVFIMGGMV